MRLRLDFFVQKGLLIQHNGRRSYYFPSTLNPTFLQMAPEFLVFHYHSKSQPDFHISHCSQWSCFSYIYIYFPSHLLSSPSFSLSLLVATQSWGHKAGSSLSPPLRFVPCIFLATRLQPFFPCRLASIFNGALCVPTQPVQYRCFQKYR